MYDWQLFIAFWKAGERGGPCAVLPPVLPSPIWTWIPCPPGPAATLGSGKFGTPWVRMHSAIFSAPCLILASWEPLIGGP